MKKNESILKITVILFLIAAFSSFILSLVYSITNPKILKNEAEKEQGNIKIIMPNVGSFEKKDDYYLVYGDSEKKVFLGYVFKTKSKGYGGYVVCNIGINKEGILTGIVIVSHSETPGLGTKIEEVKKGESEPSYLVQFKFKNFQNFREVNTISGATISSKAVINCVEEAYKIFNSLVQKGG